MIALDGLPYLTLGYPNGPGPSLFNHKGRRHNVTLDDFEDVKRKLHSPIPLTEETHGGDDVLILAKGPFAHLFSGIHEQSYLPHCINYAACLGNGLKYCDTIELPNLF
jgi:alkaline phosphatase